MLKHVLVGLGIVLAILLNALALFVLLLFNPEWRMPSQTGLDNVSLRTIAGCSQALKWEQPSRVESVVKSDNDLKVVVLANATCGAVFPVNPMANVKKNEIELSWNWWSDPLGFFAKCKCTRHIEFTVPGVDSVAPVVTIATQNQEMH